MNGWRAIIDIILTYSEIWRCFLRWRSHLETRDLSHFRHVVLSESPSENLVTLSTYFQYPSGVETLKNLPLQLSNRNMNGEVWVCKRAEDGRRPTFPLMLWKTWRESKKNPSISTDPVTSRWTPIDRMDTLWISQARDACPAGLGFFFYTPQQSNMSLENGGWMPKEKDISSSKSLFFRGIFVRFRGSTFFNEASAWIFVGNFSRSECHSWQVLLLRRPLPGTDFCVYASHEKKGTWLWRFL